MIIKKILICLLAISMTGCSVKRGTIDKDESTDVNLKIVISNRVSSKFESAAENYSSNHKNITFDIKRIDGDENYNQQLINELNNNKACAFSINSNDDINYFEKDIESMPSSLTIKDMDKVTPIALYGCGIYYNEQIIKAAGVDKSSFSSYDGLVDAIKKIDSKKKELNLKEVVASQIDLEEFASNTNFKEGGVDMSILNYYILAGKQDEDPAISLSERNAAIYIGSSRYIKEIFKNNIKESIKLTSLPYINTNDKLYECDYLAISNSASDPQKRAMYKFLEWLKQYNDYNLTPFTKKTNSTLEEDILKEYSSGKLKEGGCFKAPYSFYAAFKENDKKLKNKEISFNDFNDNLKRAYKRGKSLSY